MSFNGRELGKLVRVRGSICDSPVGCVEQRNSRFQHWISVLAAVRTFDLKMGFSFSSRMDNLYKGRSVCCCGKFELSKHTSVSYSSVFNISKKAR
jgi:hypothetical protein